MKNLDSIENESGAESAKEQFADVIHDAEDARKRGNKDDLAWALDQARTIAAQLDEEHRRDAEATIEVLTRHFQGM